MTLAWCIWRSSTSHQPHQWCNMLHVYPWGGLDHDCSLLSLCSKHLSDRGQKLFPSLHCFKVAVSLSGLSLMNSSIWLPGIALTKTFPSSWSVLEQTLQHHAKQLCKLFSQNLLSIVTTFPVLWIGFVVSKMRAFVFEWLSNWDGSCGCTLASLGWPLYSSNFICHIIGFSWSPLTMEWYLSLLGYGLQGKTQILGNVDLTMSSLIHWTRSTIMEYSFHCSICRMHWLSDIHSRICPQK